jgi:tRNA (guanine-N7-)-methyltransferase
MTDKPASHFFGRRKGKALRQGQAALIENLLPRLRIDPARLASATFADFGECEDVWLEIGFGGGEHLVSDAIRNPGVRFLGCEPFINGVAKLLVAVSEKKLANVRIHDGDALEVLKALPPQSIGRINLLYPDPWPKLRQKKRRFVSPESLALIARALRPGTEFRFATDIDDYSAWTLARVMATGWFEWPAREAADWKTPWADWSGTRYEAKAIRENRTPAYLTFIRNDRAA